MTFFCPEKCGRSSSNAGTAIVIFHSQELDQPRDVLGQPAEPCYISLCFHEHTRLRDSVSRNPKHNVDFALARDGCHLTASSRKTERSAEDSACASLQRDRDRPGSVEVIGK